MADVFLSYARADQPLAEQLAERLTEAGNSVWWDRHIHGGADFSTEIERELRSARTVVVVWSQSAIVSQWVRDEAAFARDERKLIPIRADETLPPFGFRQLQALDFSHWRGEPDDECFVTLLRSLDRILHRLPSEEFAAPAATSRRGSSASAKRRTFLLAAIALLVVVGGAITYRFADGSRGAAQIVHDEVEIRPFSAVPADAQPTVHANLFTDMFRTRLTEMGVRNVTAAPGALARSEFVLVGEVTLDGEKEILTTRLDDRATGATLWSLRKEPTAGAAWEANLAGYAISCALKRRDPQRGPGLLSRFLLGCASFLDRDMQGFYAATKAAYEAAPDDARAIAFFAVGTAGNAYVQTNSLAERKRMMVEARRLADKALSIDPKNADAAFAKGLSFLDPEFEQQERWWRASIDAGLDTGMAFGRYGNFLYMVGRTREAMDMQLRAVHDRPNLIVSVAARLFAAQGDWRQTQALYELIRPFNPASVARSELLTYVMYADVDTAARMLDERMRPDSDEYDCPQLLLDARRGRGYDAGRFTETCGGGYDSPSLFAVAGDVDGAFGQIDQLMRDNQLPEPVKLFGPEMRELRRDPRFWPLAARIGLTRYWLDTDQWPDFCTAEQVDCRTAARAAQAALEAVEPTAPRARR